MSYWYLASPYSKYPGGIDAAFVEAARQAAILVKSGVPVLSPISHTHPVAIHGGIDPFDHSIWMPVDEPLMKAARGLIVCKMDGWESSYGVSVEIDTFRDAGKPIIYMEPGVVPPELLRSSKQVIGLCGYAGSGKDAAADGLVSAGWTKFAMSDPVVDALLALDPIVGIGPAGGTAYQRAADYLRRVRGDIVAWKQHAEVRLGLQRLGTEAGREIHGYDCWVEMMRRRIDDCETNVVITGVRFLNEVEMIREYGGKIVEIERPGGGPVNSHVSESRSFTPDETLLNDGTLDDLRRRICLYADTLAKEPSEAVAA